MVYRKFCDFCGRQFVAKKASTRFCSHNCNRKAYKEKLKNNKLDIIDELKVTMQLAREFPREIMTISEASDYLGISRSTLYRYIDDGIVKALQLPGIVRVKKKEIDSLFENALPYTRRERIKKQQTVATSTVSNPYEGYVTVREFAAMFDVCLNTAQKILRQEKIRCVTFRNTGYYDKKQVINLISRHEKNQHPEITEWYTCEQIQEKYGMTKNAVYSMVYDNAVPKKKQSGQTYYSKEHIDKLKGNIDEIAKTHYTPEEVMEKYGLNRTQLHNRLKRNNIKRFMLQGHLWISKESFDSYIIALSPRFKP